MICMDVHGKLHVKSYNLRLDIYLPKKIKAQELCKSIQNICLKNENCLKV